MNVGELFVQLGVKADTVTVKEFAKAIGDLPLDIAGAITALAGMDFALGSVAENAMKTAVGFQLFTSETGLNAQKLQRWQIVAEQANVSAESVTASVKALQKNMVAISYGFGNIKPFMMLGIQPGGDPFAALIRLRGAIREMPREVFNFWAAQAGVSEDMLRVLELSDKEFLKFSGHVRGMTPGQERDFLHLKESLVQLGQEFKYLSFGFLDNLINGFSMLRENTKGFIQIVPDIVAAIGLIAIAFAPVTSAIVGLLLLMEDLAVYAQGGNSLFGYLTGTKASKLTEAIGQFSSKNPASHDMDDLIKQMPVLFPGVKAFGESLDSGVKNVFQITVHALDEAEAIAQAVVREIEKVVGHGELSFNNGGR